MGWREWRSMPTVRRRPFGHDATGPTAVFDQSVARRSAPASPPPSRTEGAPVVILGTAAAFCSSAADVTTSAVAQEGARRWNAIPRQRRSFYKRLLDRDSERRYGDLHLLPPVRGLHASIACVSRGVRRPLCRHARSARDP